MSEPHDGHAMFDVADMRAIVECAPHPGHSERNSNRFRQ